MTPIILCVKRLIARWLISNVQSSQPCISYQGECQKRIRKRDEVELTVEAEIRLQEFSPGSRRRIILNYLRLKREDVWRSVFTANRGLVPYCVVEETNKNTKASRTDYRPTDWTSEWSDRQSGCRRTERSINKPQTKWQRDTVQSEREREQGCLGRGRKKNGRMVSSCDRWQALKLTRCQKYASDRSSPPDFMTHCAATEIYQRFFDIFPRSSSPNTMTQCAATKVFLFFSPPPPNQPPSRPPPS